MTVAIRTGVDRPGESAQVRLANESHLALTGSSQPSHASFFPPPLFFFPFFFFFFLFSFFLLLFLLLLLFLFRPLFCSSTVCCSFSIRSFFKCIFCNVITRFFSNSFLCRFFCVLQGPTELNQDLFICYLLRLG